MARSDAQRARRTMDGRKTKVGSVQHVRAGAQGHGEKYEPWRNIEGLEGKGGRKERVVRETEVGKRK